MTVLAEQGLVPMVKSPPLRRDGGRLDEKILLAFQHACDSGQIEVAEQLARTAERFLARNRAAGGVGWRVQVDALVSAYFRLLELKQAAIVSVS